MAISRRKTWRRLAPGASAERLVSDWLDQYAFEVNEVFPFQLQEGEPELVLQRLRTIDADLAKRYALTLQSAVHALRLAAGAASAALRPARLRARPRRRPRGNSRALAQGSRPASGRPWRQLLPDQARVPATRSSSAPRLSHGLRAVSDLQLYLDFFHRPGAGAGSQRGDDRESPAVRRHAPRLKPRLAALAPAQRRLKLASEFERSERSRRHDLSESQARWQ